MKPTCFSQNLYLLGAYRRCRRMQMPGGEGLKLIVADEFSRELERYLTVYKSSARLSSLNSLEN